MKRVVAGKEFGSRGVYICRHCRVLPADYWRFLLPRCRRLEDLEIDFELVAVSWKLVAAAVNGTLAGVVTLLFGHGVCVCEAYAR